MTDPAAVDTNWLLDVALQRDPGSQALWAAVSQDQISLFVPSACITEAIKVLEGWDKEWRRFSDHMRHFSGIADTAAVLQASAEIADRAEKNTWTTLNNVAATTTLLEVDERAISRASSIRDLLKLSAADAVILSLVVGAYLDGVCRSFVSRDKFTRDETRAYMQQVGIAHWSSAAAFLEATLGK